MAGVGFVLRKLAKQDNLMGVAQAYAHSALASTGPWIFTIIALGSAISLAQNFISYEELYTFKVIITYNFAFSLVLAGPVFIVATRFISNHLYEKNADEVPGMLFGSLFIIYIIQSIFATVLYLGYADLPLDTALSAIANFAIISGIWLISVFITALKDYKTITKSFAAGLMISVFASIILCETYSTNGMINGFSIGLGFILASILGRIIAEYPYHFSNPFAIVPYLKKYWDMALGGLIYNLAIWIDKWVMWAAPNADCGLITNPNYDSGMFLAYLTLVPAMAIFVFKVETDFYEHYLRFYRDIQDKVTFSKIKKNHKEMVKCIISGIHNFMVIQGGVCLIAILMAPQIIDLLRIPHLQISIFRYGVLGVLYQMFMIFLLILLSYFDNRKATLWLQALFLVTNASFTWIGMKMGFDYYGAGYFLASLLTCIVAAIYTAHYISKLPYHTFITTNTSVE